MSETENGPCPRCEAPYDPEKQKIKLHGWTCGAYLHNQYGTLVTSLACRDREIAQLCERVESQAKALAALTFKYDSAVAILQAQRWRFNNLNPQGATLIDLMNSWLDQAKDHNARMTAELAVYRALLPVPPDQWDGPITHELCAALGLRQDRHSTGNPSWDDYDRSSVKVRFPKGDPAAHGTVGDRITTAKHLVLELALRRSIAEYEDAQAMRAAQELV